MNCKLNSNARIIITIVTWYKIVNKEFQLKIDEINRILESYLITNKIEQASTCIFDKITATMISNS